MQRRKFSREFKIEAVRLVGERGVSVAQASRDIDVRENVLRKWVKEFWHGSEAGFPAACIVTLRRGPRLRGGARRAIGRPVPG